jgi:TBC1 domain family member 20
MNLEGPILLGINPEKTTVVEEKSLISDQWSNLPRHPDEDQVQLDVDRAFVYYPQGLNP